MRTIEPSRQDLERMWSHWLGEPCPKCLHVECAGAAKYVRCPDCEYRAMLALWQIGYGTGYDRYHGPPSVNWIASSIFAAAALVLAGISVRLTFETHTNLWIVVGCAVFAALYGIAALAAYRIAARGEKLRRNRTKDAS